MDTCTQIRLYLVEVNDRVLLLCGQWTHIICVKNMLHLEPLNLLKGDFQSVLFVCSSTGVNFSGLSDEQKFIVDLVNNGHNVYFGGIAGCGKTFVARNIVKVLSQKKVKFACTCTTGIACTLYTECAAGTIHSFAGLGQCRDTKEELLRNVLNNAECVAR